VRKLPEKWSWEFRICFLRFQGTILRQNASCEKKLRFFNQSFSDLERKTFELLAQLFRPDFQNRVFSVHSNIFRKTVFLRTKQAFWASDNERGYCGPFLEISSLGFRKLYATFPKEQFEWRFFSNFSLVFMEHWAKHLSGFCGNFSDGVVRAVFFVSQGTFRGKWVFSGKKVFHIFWTLTKKVQAFRQKCFGRVVKTALYASWGTFGWLFEFFWNKP